MKKDRAKSFGRDTAWDSVVRASSGSVRRGSSVWRYSSIPVSQYENIIEHTGYVAIFGAMIGRKLGVSNDVLGAVAMKALVHDLDECVTGDVVRTFKYSSPEFKTAVDEASKKMAATALDLEVRDLLVVTEKMGKATRKAQLVKDIVKAADFMSLYQYVRREAARHNFEMIPYYKRMVQDLDLMASQNSSGLGGLYVAMRKEAMEVAGECYSASWHSRTWNRQ